MTHKKEMTYEDATRKVNGWEMQLALTRKGVLPPFTKEQLMGLRVARGMFWTVEKAKAGVRSNHMPIWADAVENQAVGVVDLQNPQHVEAVRSGYINLVRAIDSGKEVTEEVINFMQSLAVAGGSAGKAHLRRVV